MKVSNTLVVLSCLLLVTITGHTQDEGSAATAGFIGSRLDRIDAALQSSIDEGGIAGAVGMVARNGQIVYQKSFGYADIAAGTPMRTDSIFRIASMTKAITSVAIMMLYEQGHFRLNDPVSKFIPSFSKPTVIVTNDDGKVTGTRPAKREIRIVDLLSHSSGITYTFSSGPLQQQYRKAGIIDGLSAEPGTVGATVDKLATLPLLFDPGTDFAYGLNTDVLGYLVEVVSGQSLDEFFSRHIFTPLGMVDTYFYLPESKAARLVTLYSYVKGRGLLVSDGTQGDITLGTPDYPVQGARSYFSGGAGLSGTAMDYLRFIQMLLNEGELYGVRLLSRKSVELMRTARIDWDEDGAADFGLGFQVVGDLGKSGELGSTGAYSWGGAFNTSYWIDPEENLVGVFMSQVRPVKNDIRNSFRYLVYQALE